MRHRARAIASIVCVWLVVVQTVPAIAAGRARVLTDAELDATYAQGLVIVDVSLVLRNLANRFNFDFRAQTAIRVPDAPTGGTRPATTVNFLGGLLSVNADGSAGQGSNTGSIDLGRVGSVSYSVQSSGSTASASAPDVSVTFGNGAGGSRGQIIGIVARDVSVNTNAHIVVGGASMSHATVRGSMARAIRGALSGAP